MVSLKKITVNKFKAIDFAEINLTDATLLVGSNNAGKTSILQAIHFATRLLNQASEPNKSSTLSLTELEYVPSDDYRKLHNGSLSWGNRWDQPESKVSFEFFDSEKNEVIKANIIIKSARNEGISVTPSLPASVQSLFRGRSSMFSAYIPGIAGIPLREELISRRHVHRKAASGDSNVILRNILFRIQLAGKLDDLEKIMRRIYPGVSIDVVYKEVSDYYIGVEVGVPGKFFSKPLEFSGTGFLQTLQIFSYLLLFQPYVVLIDEPEAHLHPTVQTKLIKILEEEARRRNSKVIITTHSPFVARGLPYGSNSAWIKSGKVAAEVNDESIRKALGWGALDSSTLLCTEDSLSGQMREIIEQEESLIGRIAIFPFHGVSKGGVAKLLAQVKSNLGNSHNFVVHRDRDCMTDVELQGWIKEYKDHGLSVWVTEFSDIEMYFCQPKVLSAVLSISDADASCLVEQAISRNEDEFRKQFNDKRKEVNKIIYEKIGGSPSIEDLWATWPWQQRIKGKELLSKLREVAKDRSYDEKKIGRLFAGVIVAPKLIDLLKAK
jgi:hypothetical protein